jgi:hypothetical protein
LSEAIARRKPWLQATNGSLDLNGLNDRGFEIYGRHWPGQRPQTVFDGTQFCHTGSADRALAQMFAYCHSDWQRQSVINVRREKPFCFFAQHRSFSSFDLRFLIYKAPLGKHSNRKSKIQNQKSLEWLTDPGCPLFRKEATSDKVQGWPSRRLGDCVNGCCWPRFQIRFSGWLLRPRTLPFTSTHLAPSCCEAGAGQPFRNTCDF